MRALLNRVVNLENAIKNITAPELYAVGDIYITTSKRSPAEIFGGSWEQIQGRMLMGAGRPESNTVDAWGNIDLTGIAMTLGERGGGFRHIHTLKAGYAKIANVDGQDFNFAFDRTSVEPYEPLIKANLDSVAITNEWTNTYATELGGTSDPVNILPPYQVVYIWKRVA